MTPELTNNLRKTVASLDDAKVRRSEGLFVAEGTKCVLDTVRHFSLRHLFATALWIEEHGHDMPRGITPTLVKRADLERMSHLSTPPQVMAVYEIPDRQLDTAEVASNLTIALDRVQDPGNLGTIMRVADWMGVRQIVASTDTVDVWNPKVVQSTMGAIARVSVIYTDLTRWLDSLDGVPVYGTFLDGDNIYSSSLGNNGVIVMGNEGHGISPEVARCVTKRLSIPSYPPGEPTSESLNVAIATAITLSEFRRNG